MNNLKQYSELSYYIDWNNSEIKGLANTLASTSSSEEDIATNCFELVRDNTKHNVDYKSNPITCKATDILKYKTGYYYAKSHLLAALLRGMVVLSTMMEHRIAGMD